MIKERNILYFDPFYFKNGNTAKPKYFVVLKTSESGLILASLPTRRDAVPTKFENRCGCIELSDINFNCYKILPNQVVTNCGKCFDFPTFIYGYNLDDYDYSTLKSLYPNRGIDYEIWGEMKKDIFVDLINCLRKSRVVKNKYKKILNNG